MRLFNLLLYASLTSRFAVLRTPRGMGELVRRGAMTQAEYNALLQTGMGHHAVLMSGSQPSSTLTLTLTLTLALALTLTLTLALTLTRCSSGSRRSSTRR